MMLSGPTEPAAVDPQSRPGATQHRPPPRGARASWRVVALASCTRGRRRRRRQAAPTAAGLRSRRKTGRRAAALHAARGFRSRRRTRSTGPSATRKGAPAGRDKNHRPPHTPHVIIQRSSLRPVALASAPALHRSQTEPSPSPSPKFRAGGPCRCPGAVRLSVLWGCRGMDVKGPNPKSRASLGCVVWAAAFDRPKPAGPQQNLQKLKPRRRQIQRSSPKPARVLFFLFVWFLFFFFSVVLCCNEKTCGARAFLLVRSLCAAAAPCSCMQSTPAVALGRPDAKHCKLQREARYVCVIYKSAPAPPLFLSTTSL